MSAEYNLPLHVSAQNGDDYVIDDGYPHDGVTPPGMSWDGQSDGGGKFRLKRRRRCGQCGPCQVKENCNKCQYCMRKDVLKQACIYRKCVYLRKPVPRFRQEQVSAGGPPQKSAPTPPRKPTTTPVPPAPASTNNSNSNSSSNTITNGPSNNSSHNNNNAATPVPNPAISSPHAVGAPAPHSSELSSCRLNQSPFAALSAMQSVNNGVLDPLRHRMMEHPHRSSLFDPVNIHAGLDPARGPLDPTKPVLADASRYPGGPAAPSLNSNCKLDQTAAVVNHPADMNSAAAAAAAAAVAAASPLNSMNSSLGAHHVHHQANKALPARDPYFASMDTWSSMPYALPRHPTWATPTLPNHHAAAAAYGFQQHSAPFPSSFTPSSCRLGLPESAASRFASPAGPQHSFHHTMTGMAGFSQDYSHASPSHANHAASMRAPMNPPFYPPPPHLPPSSISSFPALGQFPAGQASFGPTAYSMHPHSHMYPSSFYSSFRTATEPQIYHVQISPNQNPFKNSLTQHSAKRFSEKGDIFAGKQTEFNDSGDKNHMLNSLEDAFLFDPHAENHEFYAKEKCVPKYSSVMNETETKPLSSETSGQAVLQVPCIPCDSHAGKKNSESLNKSDEKAIAGYVHGDMKAIRMLSLDSAAKSNNPSFCSTSSFIFDDCNNFDCNTFKQKGSKKSFPTASCIDGDLLKCMPEISDRLNCQGEIFEEDKFFMSFSGRTDETNENDSYNENDNDFCSQMVDDPCEVFFASADGGLMTSSTSQLVSSSSSLSSSLSLPLFSHVHPHPALSHPAFSPISTQPSEVEETQQLSCDSPEKGDYSTPGVSNQCQIQYRKRKSDCINENIENFQEETRKSFKRSWSCLEIGCANHKRQDLTLSLSCLKNMKDLELDSVAEERHCDTSLFSSSSSSSFVQADKCLQQNPIENRPSPVTGKPSMKQWKILVTSPSSSSSEILSSTHLHFTRQENLSSKIAAAEKGMSSDSSVNATIVPYDTEPRHPQKVATFVQTKSSTHKNIADPKI